MIATMTKYLEFTPEIQEALNYEQYRSCCRKGGMIPTKADPDAQAAYLEKAALDSFLTLRFQLFEKAQLATV